MDDFEELLNRERSAVERFVRYRVPEKADAEDILQETYLAAFRAFPNLRDKAAFKGWLLQIARSKCNDWFRAKANLTELSLDSVPETELIYGPMGIIHTGVEDAMERLRDRDKQILYLYYWKELSQADIARRLNIPLGTVKSRLHTARRNFKEYYPYSTEKPKGENMKKLPELLPDYTVEPSDRPPFSVKWEELPGWFLVPKPGESLTWAMYDLPSRQYSNVYDMSVTGKARVHGIDGVEVTVRDTARVGPVRVPERKFIVQLTDTHCRYLATVRKEDGVTNYITFLDGEEFMSVWGLGRDNCGNETDLTPRGLLRREGNTVTGHAEKPDIMGRCTVNIAGRSYDTVCVMDLELEAKGVVTEQFLDKNGRTILWRRYNRDDWAIDRYKKSWTEQLPDNGRLTVNGKTFVHWYDCITDYIL